MIDKVKYIIINKFNLIIQKIIYNVHFYLKYINYILIL